MSDKKVDLLELDRIEAWANDPHADCVAIVDEAIPVLIEEIHRLHVIESKAAGLVRTAHPEVGKREVVRQWWDALVAALEAP